MPNTASLHRLGLVVALAAAVAGCGGAGRLADRGGAAAVPDRTAAPVRTAAPAARATASAAPATAPNAGPTGSTSVTDLLRDADSFLNATDAAISAEATAAITQGE